VPVSNNPYEMGDIAGFGHRARLDAGTLGVVVVTVNSAMGAVGLLGGGVKALSAGEVVVDSDEPEIPVGIDEETVMMPTPVRCVIRRSGPVSELRQLKGGGSKAGGFSRTRLRCPQLGAGSAG
jgi:hypothetical protein